MSIAMYIIFCLFMASICVFEIGVLNKLRDIYEHVKHLYIPVPIKQPTPEEMDMAVKAIISLRESADALAAKLDERAEEKAADPRPDGPDEDERSEEAKKAEKAFSEGVLSILNYDIGDKKEAKA